MDGIGGTIQNVVFKVNSGRVVINSAEKFIVAANNFVPSILLCEPDDINQSPSIPATLQTHIQLHRSLCAYSIKKYLEENELKIG